MYTICVVLIALIYLFYRSRQIIIAHKENDTRLCLIISMPILFWIFFVAGFWQLNVFFLPIMILIMLFFSIAPIFTLSLFGKYWSDNHVKYVLSVDAELICFIIPSMLFGSMEGGGVLVNSSLKYEVYFFMFKLFELR